MLIRKLNVKSCVICNQIQHPQIPDPEWVRPEDAESEQTAPMVEDPNWSGVPGYEFRRESDNRWWPDVEICDKCITMTQKAVNLINGQKITAVEL